MRVLFLVALFYMLNIAADTHLGGTFIKKQQPRVGL